MAGHLGPGPGGARGHLYGGTQRRTVARYIQPGVRICTLKYTGVQPDFVFFLIFSSKILARILVPDNRSSLSVLKNGVRVRMILQRPGTSNPGRGPRGHLYGEMQRRTVKCKDVRRPGTFKPGVRMCTLKIHRILARAFFLDLFRKSWPGF